jgi:hypothetical protein
MSDHYFVVKYNDVTGWEWDVETESAHFPEGTLYIDGKWVRSGDLFGGDQHKLYDIDEQASEQLGRAMDIMNGDM